MERVESQEHEDGASGESLDQPAEEEVCAICLDELFELTVIKIKCLMIQAFQTPSCKHTFCQYCIKDWWRGQQNCPSCRSNSTNGDLASAGLDMSLIVAEAKDRETMEERARNLMARERDGLMLRWSFCIPITLLVLYTFGLRAVKLKKESKGRDAGIS